MLGLEMMDFMINLFWMNRLHIRLAMINLGKIQSLTEGMKPFYDTLSYKYKSVGQVHIRDISFVIVKIIQMSYKYSVCLVK